MIFLPFIYLYVYSMALLGYVLIAVYYLTMACAAALLVAVPATIVWKVVTIILGG